MSRRDTKVTDYLGSRAPFARPILEPLRASIHEADDPPADSEIRSRVRKRIRLIDESRYSRCP